MSTLTKLYEFIDAIGIAMRRPPSAGPQALRLE